VTSGRSDEGRRDRLVDRVDSRDRVQLDEDIAQVPLHRGFGERQHGRDLAIAERIRRQLKYLPLSHREYLARGLVEL